jgi:hypothetical protein
MRIPDPIPFGLTFLLAMTLAIVSASFVYRPAGGKVDTVVTVRTHFFGGFFRRPAPMGEHDCELCASRATRRWP